MKTIEFFGAPGVGKSYFLEHFGKYNSSNSYQIVQDKTVLSKIKSNSKNELSEKIRWLVYRILNHPQRHLLGEFGKEYVINNQEIVKYIWDLFDNRIDNIYALDLTGDVLLTGGGIIPKEDMRALSKLGVGKMFGPGTTVDSTIEYIENWVNENRN